MALTDPNQSFIWGAGGAQMTPEEIAKQRALEAAVVAHGVDTSPVGSWTQGLARVADALAGSVRRGRLDRAQSANIATDKELAAPLVAALSGSAVSPNSVAAPGSTTAPASGPIAPGDPNDIQTQFLDTVKNGYDVGNGQKLAVTNPYGLAAIAATGKAESGWSPQNAGGTWADGANPAGGIMSWNGPRLANLQKFAGGTNGTPQQQGQFFLQENPDLIAKLNAAGSVEEAQNLMNNAWAFKGYNQPGNPNAAHRLALANGYLPQFQGSNTPAAAAIQQQAPIGNPQVASLDPSAGMATRAPTPQPQAAPQDMSTLTPSQLTGMLGNPGYVDPQVSAQGQIPTNIPVPIPRPMAPAPIAPPTPNQQVAQALPSPSAAPAQASGVSPAILKALTSPYASETTQKLASILVQREQARQQAAYELQLKQSDPEYQANLAKAQWEAAHLGQVSPDTAATLKKPIDVNGHLVTPDGKEIADFSNRQVSTVDGSLIDNRTGQPIYQSRKPMDVNGHLIDPTTGQQVGDYSNPQTSTVGNSLVDQRTGQVIYQGQPNAERVEPGTSLVNPQTGKVVYQGTSYKPADVTDLRKEIQGLPNYKSYQQAAPVYQSMVDTAKTDSKASDLNLVYGLGKIMDPNSVVREGEMVMVNNTSSLPDWLMGAINSVNGGSKLEPATRKAILTEARSRMGNYRNSLDNDLNQYRGIVGRRGMNPEDVIPVLNPVADVPDLSGAPTQKAFNPRTGEALELRNGQWMRAQ